MRRWRVWELGWLDGTSVTEELVGSSRISLHLQRHRLGFQPDLISKANKDTELVQTAEPAGRWS